MSSERRPRSVSLRHNLLDCCSVRHAADPGRCLRTIRVRRYKLKREDALDSFHVACIAGHQYDSSVPAGVRQENVEREATAYLRQLQSFLFAERRECQPQGIPGRRRRRQHSTPADEWSQHSFLQRPAGLRGTHAGAQLRGNYATQEQARRAPAAETNQPRQSFRIATGVYVAVGIHAVLAH
jgi:hypothetical protein